MFDMSKNNFCFFVKESLGTHFKESVWGERDSELYFPLISMWYFNSLTLSNLRAFYHSVK